MYLLDTCTLLWWLAEPDRLPPKVRDTISDPAIAIVVSVVTLWEVLVKVRLGKIRIRTEGDEPYAFLVKTLDASGFERRPLLEQDLRHLTHLPVLHRDPFDRMLICQAIEGALTLVTPDPTIQRYPIRTLWV
ncbi:PIN domain nuclease, a component of toxin-antitoxin system (PIN domain) [Fontimonas thermophila]|uniref:PIN domain nuclease, a component of toxin-antitoxin system (PIN domain) n=1 Tax=Fontimonas thermophila TaxID=1076937 RepID=A0A1I2J178_9GAMM|nr:type II toxin-antitoxin system VapC family toxin [Fontimonas thermophila]SFF47623.1 PIN domain nuclease, a component of toxin-antitoxin system (PIN domain) [Fontimonas thermophila]